MSGRLVIFIPIEASSPFIKILVILEESKCRAGKWLSGEKHWRNGSAGKSARHASRQACLPVPITPALWGEDRWIIATHWTAETVTSRVSVTPALKE